MISAPLAFLCLTYASMATGMALQKRAVDFFDPALGGGSIFDNATFGGEPLNVWLFLPVTIVLRSPIDPRNPLVLYRRSSQDRAHRTCSPTTGF